MVPPLHAQVHPIAGKVVEQVGADRIPHDVAHKWVEHIPLRKILMNPLQLLQSGLLALVSLILQILVQQFLKAGWRIVVPSFQLRIT